ncbi:hypothetical protein U1Q18_021670 [Sarracenia purpurea var. burkii]
MGTILEAPGREVMTDVPESTVPNADQIKLDSDKVNNAECYVKFKAAQPDETARISSNTQLEEWGQSNLADTVSGAGTSSSQALSSRSLGPSSRFLSRFSFFPGNISFRLSRAMSVGSSRAYPISSTRFTISNEEEELHHLHTGPAHGLVNGNESSRGRSCGNLESNTTISGISDSLQGGQNSSGLNVARDIDNPREDLNVNLHSPRVDTDIESMETRLPDRREPVDRNVHFSRTLSVGRLRHRVLRRPSFPYPTFSPLHQEREVSDAASQRVGREALGGGTGATAPNEDALISSSSAFVSSSMPSSLYSGQDFEVETSSITEARYHDLLEHRSNFLERRRRIRSQRLGSRFENLSRRERSCIISGQHRTGHCTCPIRTRDTNSNDDTGARASISRIVMLAEALFEVLDEIHQQSVVLSSQPSVSSIGSVPAPNEIVEALPVKLYSRSRKHLSEEAAQCYICLVEYEEGESVRILPCHHEFHRICVDKWLKEIHRVCPLCRGDICTLDSVSPEN